MSKITEFNYSDEHSLVSRVLISVHQAIDKEFPHTTPPSKRFAKTAFTTGEEPTINQPLPSESKVKIGPLGGKGPSSLLKEKFGRLCQITTVDGAIKVLSVMVILLIAILLYILMF